jgi:hypothetical protein
MKAQAAQRSGWGGERSRSCAAESRSTTCMVAMAASEAARVFAEFAYLARES